MKVSKFALKQLLLFFFKATFSLGSENESKLHTVLHKTSANQIKEDSNGFVKNLTKEDMKSDQIIFDKKLIEFSPDQSMQTNTTLMGALPDAVESKQSPTMSLKSQGIVTRLFPKKRVLHTVYLGVLKNMLFNI